MSLVTRSIKRAKRLWTEDSLSEMKTAAHRAHRRRVGQELGEIVKAVNSGVNPVDLNYDLSPQRNHMLTAWEVI